MKALVFGRISVAKAGWFIVAFLIVWPLFLLWPGRSKQEPSRRLSGTPITSKLLAVGLEDNPEWEGLPELFAVFESRAGWINDRAQFAYWDRWSHSYAYFFEATRVNGAVRFHSIPEPDFIDGSGSSYAKIYAGEEPGMCMVSDSDLKSESPEHPFVFFRPVPAQVDMPLPRLPRELDKVSVADPKVNVDVGSSAVKLPEPTTKAGALENRR